MFEQQIQEIILSLAYKPMLLYGAITAIMILSSFGLPIPEEVSLVTTGIACYYGAHPEIHPPPYPGAIPVDPYTAGAVALFAVFLSDYLIFMLGRKYGVHILEFRFFKKYQSQLDKISNWVKRYGFWASGIFRFTPGLRFPGHFSCGMMGLAPWKFVAVDGTAALISVPTQIFLVTFYGKQILDKIKQFKIIFFSIVAVIILIIVAIKLKNHFSAKKAKKNEAKSKNIEAIETIE